MSLNFRGIGAIYRFEMARFRRTLTTSLFMPAHWEIAGHTPSRQVPAPPPRGG